MPGVLGSARLVTILPLRHGARAGRKRTVIPPRASHPPPWSRQHRAGERRPAVAGPTAAPARDRARPVRPGHGPVRAARPAPADPPGVRGVRAGCPARVRLLAPARRGAGLARVPSVHGLGHVLSGAVSAVVVLAAFGGLLGLAGRVLGSRSRSPYPRLRVPGRRGRAGRLAAGPRRLVGWRCWRGRFAAGAPLGQRRTDATFLTAGTKPIGGVPGWFTTGQPGRWAYLPGWKRAAVRWAVVAAAAGLMTRPLITGVVLGVLAIGGGAAGLAPLPAVAVRTPGDPPGLPPALPVPRHRPGRPARPLAGHPGRVHRRPGRAGDAGLPAGLEPRRRPAKAHRRGHPPAPGRRPGRRVRPVPGHLDPPARTPGPGPVRRVRPARPQDPPGHPGRRPEVDRGPARRGTAPVHRGRHRRRQDRHRVHPGRARPGATAGWSTSSTPSAGPTSAAKPATTCWSTCPASGCTPTSSR